MLIIHKTETFWNPIHRNKLSYAGVLLRASDALIIPAWVQGSCHHKSLEISHERCYTRTWFIDSKETRRSPIAITRRCPRMAQQSPDEIIAEATQKLQDDLRNAHYYAEQETLVEELNTPSRRQSSPMRSSFRTWKVWLTVSKKQLS